MSKKILAIANCRVSSDEQLLNNSIGRQRASVYAAAEKLGVEIIEVWSGSVSSKAGTNVRRKDLLAMLDRCKHNKAIKFAIFDEYDRYMRSVNEGPYFEVLFQELGVKVWYASESDTFNGDDAMAKFMRAMSAFKAEGSNEERQRKSISGQSKALKDGRYPFNPKPGYMRGRKTGVPEIHPVRGPALQAVLIRLVTQQITPTQGVKELNASEYCLERKPIKMDKFKKIATDPFNAGILEVHKQVDVHNPGGIHEPLITPEQHLELLKIFDKRKKYQLGPRKNGNPEYPLSNHVTCALCTTKSTIPRYVGFPHSNGKNAKLIYHKYRCRSCGRYITREELHSKVTKLLSSISISQTVRGEFLEALATVWKQKESQAVLDSQQISRKISNLNESVESQAIAAIDPANAPIKDEILKSIAKKKEMVKSLEDELDLLTKTRDEGKKQFLEFAFNFIEKFNTQFFSLSHQNRLRCKQLLFPAGFYLDENNKVYTPETSLIYRLLSSKKDLPDTEKSLLVRVQGL